MVKEYNWTAGDSAIMPLARMEYRAESGASLQRYDYWMHIHWPPGIAIMKYHI
jgi:hypothetical protein